MMTLWNTSFRRLFSLALLLLGALACSEVVDLKSDGGLGQLVIHGRITDGIAGNKVTISLTSSFNGNQKSVSGAEVTLIENGLPLAKYVEDFPGSYLLDYDSDSAEAGKSYALSVILADGTEYRSKPALMPGLAAVDEPYFDASVVDVQVNQAGISQERNLVQLFIDTQVITPDLDFFLKWDILETYSFQERIRVSPVPPDPCYVTNDITGTEVRLFNGAALKVESIENQLLVSTEIDSRFAFDYYFSVIQYTMNEEAFNYWSRIDQIANLEGSIFDQASGPAQGNLYNPNDPKEEVLGYFEVVRADTTRTRIRADAIDFFVQVPCPHQLRDSEPPACTFCPLLENSTIVRPYFFDD